MPRRPEWVHYKLQKGEWINAYPFGYKVKGSVRKKNTDQKRTKYSIPGTVYLNEKEAQIVRDIYKYYIEEVYSYKDLARYIEEIHDRRPTRPSFIWRVLTNPFYKGIMVYDGKEYPHKYPTIVDEETWKKAQEIRNTRNSKIKHKRDRYLDLVERKKNEKENPLLDLLGKNTFTLREYMSAKNVDAFVAQGELFDLELDKKIEEVGPSLWRILDN